MSVASDNQKNGSSLVLNTWRAVVGVVLERKIAQKLVKWRIITQDKFHAHVDHEELEGTFDATVHRSAYSFDLCMTLQFAVG